MAVFLINRISFRAIISAWARFFEASLNDGDWNMTCTRWFGSYNSGVIPARTYEERARNVPNHQSAIPAGSGEGFAVRQAFLRGVPPHLAGRPAGGRGGQCLLQARATAAWPGALSQGLQGEIAGTHLLPACRAG